MASCPAAADVSRRDALKAVGALVAGATFGLSGFSYGLSTVR